MHAFVNDLDKLIHSTNIVQYATDNQQVKHVSREEATTTPIHSAAAAATTSPLQRKLAGASTKSSLAVPNDPPITGGGGSSSSGNGGGDGGLLISLTQRLARVEELSRNQLKEIATKVPLSTLYLCNFTNSFYPHRTAHCKKKPSSLATPNLRSIS